MKKIILSVAILTVSTLVSSASISINMKNTQGCWYPTSGTLLSSGALVQMIWSADNAYANPIQGQIGTPSGDYVLFSGTTTTAGGFSTDMDGLVDYTNANVGGGANNINAGFIYIYVFQNGTPTANDYYVRSAIYNTSTFADASGLPKPLASVVDVSPSAKSVLNTLQVQPVPEPSSIALIGIGLGLIVMRKRFQSK